MPQWRDAREIVFQDEPGSEPPITHVFFLPSDDNLGPAPFPVAGQSDPSDEVQAAGAEEEGEVGAGSSSAQRKTQLADWRQRRSVSRVRSGKRTVYVVRLVSPRAGFGRRRCLGRCLASAVAEQEEGASGDTTPWARDVYKRQDIPRPIAAKAAARQLLPQRAKAAAAAAVLEAVSSIASSAAGPGQSGQHDYPGKILRTCVAGIGTQMASHTEEEDQDL